jgi:hypothetical protein
VALALDASLGQGNSAANTVTTFNTTSAVATGAIIVVAVGWFHNGVSTVAITGGGLTWAEDAVLRSGSLHISLQSAKALSGLVTNTTLTATRDATSDCIMGGGSFTGVDTSGTIRTGFNTGSGTGTTHTSGSISANAGDLIVEASFQDGSGTATGAATAPAALLFNKTVAGQTEALVFTYKLGMAATDSIGGTWSASVTHIDGGASYLALAAATGAPFVPHRMPLGV